MKDIEIILSVGDGHCIECAAKREYDRRMIHVMTTDTMLGPEEEETLELLLDFLKNANFAALRASDDRLAGAADGRCIIRRNDDSSAIVSIIL